MAGQRIPGSLGSSEDSSPEGPSPGSPSGGFSTPGPVGLDAEPLDSPAKGGKAKTTVERTYVGEYQNPWETNPAAEVAILEEGKKEKATKHWSPGTIDFEALSKSTTLANSFPSFLALLLKETPGTVSRANIITHGDFGRIGFKGTIDVNNGDVFFDSDPDAALTSTSLSKWVNSTLIDDNNKSHTWDEIKAAFSSGAQIFIYSCNGATDPQLLQEMADAFGVKVNGNNKAVVYCVDFNTNPPKVNRNLHKVAINDQPTQIKSCETGGKSDFHDLGMSRSASPKKKQTP
jgi:hypothetical protein